MKKECKKWKREQGKGEDGWENEEKNTVVVVSKDEVIVV